MELRTIAEKLRLTPLTPELEAAGRREITAGHASDLLSDALANAPRGGVLVTIQVHMNVIAVAAHAGLAAVIFAGGRTPEEDVRRQAVDEDIALYGSSQGTFNLCAGLFALGVRGRDA